VRPASRAGGAPLEQRALDDLPRAARLLRALDEALTRAAGRPLRYHVHGGFVRAALAGGAFSDVDVAAAAAPDLLALHAVGRRGLSVPDEAGAPVSLRLDVRRRVVATPEALLADVDVVAWRAAFSSTDGCLHVDPDCLGALADGLLTLRRGALGNPERTIARTLKGAARGGRLPLADLERSVAAVRETPSLTHWLRRGMRALRHSSAYAAGGPASSRPC
jgi:hypothetical protein